MRAWGSRRWEGGQVQVRPCPGQEQKNPCTACFDRVVGIWWLGPLQVAGHLLDTLHAQFSWCTHTWVLPSVANLAAKCYVISCWLLGTYLLPRPDFSGFFKFLRTKGGYSLALCWDSAKDLEKEELLQMSPSWCRRDQGLAGSTHCGFADVAGI